MLSMIGGAAVGYFGARMIPQNIPQLAPYNSGWSGYALNVASGLGLAWLAKRFVNARAGMGVLVGTGVAVIARVITDNAGGATPSTQAGAAAAMSGMGSDLDFDLGYYIDTFPFPQGAAAGPYGPFVGNPLGGRPAIATGATAVQAGQIAAQNALPAGQVNPATVAASTGMRDGWAGNWS